MRNNPVLQGLNFLFCDISSMPGGLHEHATEIPLPTLYIHLTVTSGFEHYLNMKYRQTVAS